MPKDQAARFVIFSITWSMLKLAGFCPRGELLEALHPFHQHRWTEILERNVLDEPVVEFKALFSAFVPARLKANYCCES